MTLVFEYCLYLGIVLALIGIVWLITSLVKKPRRVVPPLFLLMLSLALILGPAIISRTMSVNLGMRDRIVNNERHLSLTGWDGEGYAFLNTMNDTAVLQMANGDVTDETLDYLSNMSMLRELDLNDSVITDAGLAKLAKLPNLETLRLRATKITDAGFREHLMNAATLKQLDLRQTEVDPETVEAWKSGGEARMAFR